MLFRSDPTGRRRGERFARDADAEITLRGEPSPRRARLRDLSFSGLQLLVGEPVPAGSIVRVKTAQFDALVSVVACRKGPGGHSLHGQLLTLALVRQARGLYVNTQA